MKKPKGGENIRMKEIIEGVDMIAVAKAAAIRISKEGPTPNAVTLITPCDTLNETTMTAEPNCRHRDTSQGNTNVLCKAEDGLIQDGKVVQCPWQKGPVAIATLTKDSGETK